MMNKDLQTRSFHALDALRLVAAVAVMMRHMPDHGMLRLLPGSYLAVDLFFCLSGFVLAHAYAARLKSGAMGLGDFVRARVLRLWPLYLLATAVGMVLEVWLGKIHHEGADFWAVWAWSSMLALFMLPSPGWASISGFSPFSYCSPAWSLFWEMAVGLLYAALAPTLSTRRLALVLMAGATMLVGAGMIHHGLDIGPMLQTFGVGGTRVLWSFFAGVAVHRLWLRDTLPWLRLPLWITIPLLLAIFAIDPGEQRAAVDILSALVLFPLLLLAATRPVASRWQPLCMRMGEASYALYVLHVPLLEWTQRSLERSGHDFVEAGTWGTLLFSTVMLVIAFTVERRFDLPIRRALATTRGSRRLEQPAGLRPGLGGNLRAR